MATKEDPEGTVKIVKWQTLWISVIQRQSTGVNHEKIEMPKQETKPHLFLTINQKTTNTENYFPAFDVPYFDPALRHYTKAQH